MSVTASTRVGNLALAIALAGVLLGIIISVVGSLLDRHWTMHGFLVFSAFQAFAMVCGFTSFGTATGRSAAIGSSLLLAGSLVMFVLHA